MAWEHRMLCRRFQGDVLYRFKLQMRPTGLLCHTTFWHFEIQPRSGSPFGNIQSRRIYNFLTFRKLLILKGNKVTIRRGQIERRDYAHAIEFGIKVGNMISEQRTGDDAAARQTRLLPLASLIGSWWPSSSCIYCFKSWRRITNIDNLLPTLDINFPAIMSKNKSLAGHN